MNNFKFGLNWAGLDELRKSPEMQRIIQTHADAIKARAGEGYTTEVKPSKDRAVGFVYAETREAKRDCYDNNTLLKVVRG